MVKAKEIADIVVMSWHWGLSPYQLHPGAGPGDVEVMEYQKEMAHFVIDCGVDLVLGHHSHQPQPIEIYNGKAIFYSLANFVHDLADFKEMKFMAIFSKCLIKDGKISQLSFIPGTIDGNGPPVFGKPADLPDVVNRMQEMSSSYGTKFKVNDEEVVIVL